MRKGRKRVCMNAHGQTAVCALCKSLFFKNQAEVIKITKPSSLTPFFTA